jgi:hypothetical protein
MPSLQFPEVSEVIQKFLRDPELQPEFQSVRQMFPKDKLYSEIAPISLDYLAALLPEQSVANACVAHYTRYCENVHRILDIPTFLDQCEQFWDGTFAQEQSFRAMLIPQLTLVVAMGARIESFGIAGSVPSMFEPRKLLSAVEAWQFGLRGRGKLRLEAIQADALLVLAKRLYAVPPVEIWRSTGDLVRSALLVGLNKDPDELVPELPLQESQLRRRIWYTIANLDIEASLSCRMPSIIQSVTSSCRYSALDLGDSARSPEPPSGQAREIQFQSLSSASLEARLRALEILQVPHPDLDHISKTMDELIALHRSLQSAVQTATNCQGGSERYGTVLLELQLLQPMVLLHTLALQLPITSHRARSPVTQCPSICLSVLSQWELLDPEQSECESMSNSIPCKLMFTLHGDEFIRAAYMACFYFKLAASDQPEIFQRTSNYGPGAPEIPSSAVKHMIKDMINSFVTLAPILRAFIKHVMGLVMCLEVMKKGVHQARREQLMKSSLRQLLNQCRDRCSVETFRSSVADSADLDVLITEPDFEWWGGFATQDYTLYSGILE